MAAYGGKFYKHLHFTTMEKVNRRNITEPVLHIRVFKRIHYCRVA